jgi:putative DNA primase/helicase
VCFWDPDEPANQGKGLPEELRADKQLDQKLAAEHEGILAWLVRGCRDWLENGLGIPEAVAAATAAYRDAEDVLAQFFAEKCVRGPDFRCRAGQLHGAYKQWCEATGEEALSLRAFGEAVTKRGISKKDSNGTWYLGIALRDPQREREPGEDDPD